MAEILSAAGLVFNYAVTGVTAVGTAITGTPILLCSAVVSLGCIAVGLFKRLISTNI